MFLFLFFFFSPQLAHGVWHCSLGTDQCWERSSWYLLMTLRYYVPSPLYHQRCWAFNHLAFAGTDGCWRAHQLVSERALTQYFQSLFLHPGEGWTECVATLNSTTAAKWHYPLASPVSFSPCSATLVYNVLRIYFTVLTIMAAVQSSDLRNKKPSSYKQVKPSETRSSYAWNVSDNPWLHKHRSLLNQ